jgi:hypothetical protein
MPKHNHNAIGLVIPHAYLMHTGQWQITNQVEPKPKRVENRPANDRAPNTVTIQLPDAIQQIVDGIARQHQPSRD